MGYTTAQIKGLLLSAASLAADLQGLGEQETKAQLLQVEAEFDVWYDRLSSGHRVEDWYGNTVALTKGDRIKLMGHDWDDAYLRAETGGQGTIHTVKEFDTDTDPMFKDKHGDLRYACRGEDNYRGFVKVNDDDEEEDE